MTNLFPRSSGILLHPTALPGPYGIGDLGQAAYAFIDTLASAGQTVWQILPLGPTGFGESPYQTFSSFAGNTNLISLDKLKENGWLTDADLAHRPYFPARKMDYPTVIAYHDELLSLAFDRFMRDANAQVEFEAWCASDAAFWLENWALFIAIKEFYGLQPWTSWAREQAFRAEAALREARTMHQPRIMEHRFRQWVFHRQWNALRAYANAAGIRIVGDLPIYVAHDSADVWVNRHLFDLDGRGYPNHIAGVPPDYFSSTGQRWGNPLYMWDEHARTGYAYWIRRLNAMLRQVDIVRIDHFRAFDRYYSIPGDHPTAQGGHWVPGPKMDYFRAVSAGLGRALDELPIIAEDLGDDIADAVALRQKLHLPGMAILQFAFSGGGDDSRFLPDNHEENMIVYTGTHDNNTVWGWWTCEASDHEKERLAEIAGKKVITDPAWELIEMGMASVGHTFVAPLQDVLGLGLSARMNKPGVPGGQWRWRCLPQDLDPRAAHWARLAHLAAAYGRTP
jgi:4-alpha-glucanotransferase